jgi:hypothetical protein
MCSGFCESPLILLTRAVTAHCDVRYLLFMFFFAVLVQAGSDLIEILETCFLGV